MKALGRRAACRALMITTAIGATAGLSEPLLAQQAGTQPTQGPQSGPGAAPTSAVTAQSPSAGPATAAAVPTGGNEEITVTARRTSESAQRVPIALTTVTAQRLTDLNVRDVLEIQKVTPGLFISSQNTAGRVKLTIRGQTEADSRLTTDGSVGVYVDGVNWARDYGMRSALVDIAQIEVLRGPQGTLFGKNTTGGALNITTQHPTYEPGGYVDMLFGSYHNAQGLAVVNAPLIDNRLALRLVGQVISRGGFGHGADGEPVGNDHVVNGRALLRADPTDNVHILLSADYVRQRDNGSTVILTNDSMLAAQNSATGVLGEIARELGLNPASAADRLTAYNAFRVYYDAYQNQGHSLDNFTTGPNGHPLVDQIDHYGFSGNIDVNLGNVTMTSITAYRHLKKYYTTDSDGTPFQYIFGSLRTTESNFSQELRLSSIDNVGLDWQGGLYYNRETGNEFSANNNNIFVNANRATVTDADIRNTSKAAYAQAVYNFGARVRLTGGIRYTEDTRFLNSHNRIDPAYELPPILPGGVSRCNLLNPTAGGPIFPNCSYAVSTSSHRVTWLLGADWRPVPELMLYASVSTGYRSGGFTFNGSGAVQPTLTALQAQYAPFLPEDVTNYEAGFKSDLLDRRLRINGSFYYQDYRNIQRQIRDIIEGVNVNLIRNAATAKLYGGELELTARPTDELTLNASVAYLHTRYGSFFARDAAGNLLDFTDSAWPAPKWTYNLGASYRIPLRSGFIRLSANWDYIGTVNFQPGQPGVPLTAYDPASVTQRGYGLLDARITWHFNQTNLDLSVFGKNLTNRRYLNAASQAQANGFNIGFPGDPRVFGVQARYTF